MPRTTSPPIVVCPDGTIDIQWIDGGLRIAGPDVEPTTETIAANTSVIGFRFRPAAAPAWLGISADELAGKRIMLEDLWGRKARKLADGINTQETVSDAITSLETALMSHVQRRPVDLMMREAYNLAEKGPPPDTPLISWLARSLVMSERTLRRRFHESFGYGSFAIRAFFGFRLAKSRLLPCWLTRQAMQTRRT